VPSHSHDANVSQSVEQHDDGEHPDERDRPLTITRGKGESCKTKGINEDVEADKKRKGLFSYRDLFLKAGLDLFGQVKDQDYSRRTK
jgi:hypothetical protein